MKLMIVKNMDVSISLEGIITSVIGPSNSGKFNVCVFICLLHSNIATNTSLK